MDRAARRMREWWGPTTAPAQWGLVTHAVAGMFLGAALGRLLAPDKGAILAGLTGALVAAAGAAGPSRVAMRLAWYATVAGVVGTGLAFATIGHPILAAIAMAAVAMLTSLAAGAGPVGIALGTLVSLSYALSVALALMSGLSPDVSLASGLARIIVGCLAGLLVTFVAANVRDRRNPSAAAKAAPPPAPLRQMARSLRAFDHHARDGVRRAIPLAIGIYLLQRVGTRDALWVFFSAFIILLPTGKPPLALALSKVAVTVSGVVLLGLAALVMPTEVLAAVALVILLLGMVYQHRYPMLGGGLTAMGAILLAGAPSGAIGLWATHRVVDTILGCSLALATTYLLWPADQPSQGPSLPAAPEPSP